MGIPLCTSHFHDWWYQREGERDWGSLNKKKHEYREEDVDCWCGRFWILHIGCTVINRLNQGKWPRDKTMWDVLVLCRTNLTNIDAKKEVVKGGNRNSDNGSIILPSWVRDLTAPAPATTPAWTTAPFAAATPTATPAWTTTPFTAATPAAATATPAAATTPAATAPAPMSTS